MLSAICVPRFTGDDLALVQAIRSAHDAEYFRLIEPHFTLVFPTDSLPEPEFIAHLSAAAHGVSAMSFAVRCAIPFREAAPEPAFVYLVPDEGFSWFVRLHALLYSGALAHPLRSDKPYIPHITVGRTHSFGEAKTVADRFNSERHALAGRVENLDLVRVDTAGIEFVHSIPLNGG